MIPDQTYCNVNGFVKKINDTAILNAFRVVVTVTVVVAPTIRTSVNTICMPRYPVTLNRKLNPYVSVGC